MTARRWLWEYLLPPLALFALVATAWQAATSWWSIPAYLLPSPAGVWNAALEHHRELATATAMTAGGALAGFALGVLVGTLLGFVFSQSKVIERSVYPYAIFLQTVPIVAIAPLMVTWLGAGFASVVVVSLILSMFPVLTAATAGLTRVDPHMAELFALHGATRWQTLVKLRLPSAVPSLVTGAKISCGLSVIGAIVGEMFAGYNAGQFGLGYLITMSTGQLETAYALAAILASTLLSIAIFLSVNLLGSTILARWTGLSRGSSRSGARNSAG